MIDVLYCFFIVSSIMVPLKPTYSHPTVPYPTLFNSTLLNTRMCVTASASLPLSPGRVNAASVTRSVARRHPMDLAWSAAIKAHDWSPCSRRTHQDIVTMLILVMMILIDLSHCGTLYGTITSAVHYTKLYAAQHAEMYCNAVQHTALLQSTYVAHNAV